VPSSRTPQKSAVLLLIVSAGLSLVFLVGVFRLALWRDKDNWIDPWEFPEDPEDTLPRLRADDWPLEDLRLRPSLDFSPCGGTRCYGVYNLRTHECAFVRPRDRRILKARGAKSMERDCPSCGTAGALVLSEEGDGTIWCESCEESA